MTMTLPPTRPSRGTKTERGFSLAEMLVTLGILGMAAALLLGGLDMVRHFSPGTSDAARAHQEVVAAQTILRDRLERMRGLVRLDSNVPQVDAAGTQTSFSFHAPPLPRAAPDTLQRFRLMLNAAGDVMLYAASGLDSRIDLRDPALSHWQPTRLIRGARAMKISYYGPGPMGDAAVWQSNWRDRAEPPLLVRVEVTFADNDRRYWPDLVVRPRVNVNTACRIDRYSHRCAVNI